METELLSKGDNLLISESPIPGQVLPHCEGKKEQESDVSRNQMEPAAAALAQLKESGLQEDLSSRKRKRLAEAAGPSRSVKKVSTQGRNISGKRKREVDAGGRHPGQEEMDAARALMKLAKSGTKSPPAKRSRRLASREVLMWIGKGKRSGRGRRREMSACLEEKARNGVSLPSSSDADRSSSELFLGTPDDGCVSDFEKHDQSGADSMLCLNSSDSSTDFLRDSGDLSPISPLPPPPCEPNAAACDTAKLLRVDAPEIAVHGPAPLRPLRKLLSAGKVECNVTEGGIFKLEDVVTQQVGKKKSKPLRYQATAVGVKVERSSSETHSVASLGDGGRQAAEQEVDYVKQLEGTAISIKEETKDVSGIVKIPVASQKTGQRNGVKFKPPLSEHEKETRRLRRVQANRESARQTIRKKQLHCEELALKATELASQQEVLQQEYHLKLKELHTLREVQRQLKEQLARHTGIKDAKATAKDSVCMPLPTTTCMPPFQYPMPHPYANPYLWGVYAAATMAREAVKNLMPSPVIATESTPAMTIQFPVTSGSLEQGTPSPMISTSQPSTTRPVGSGESTLPRAFSEQERTALSQSSLAGNRGGEAGPPCLPPPEMKDPPVRSVNLCFQGQVISTGGKASFIRLPSLPHSIPLGLPGMAMLPNLAGPDAVGGSNMSFAFQPGHATNQTGVVRSSQVAGKLSGVGASLHGGHFFYDRSHQQGMATVSGTKASGAAAAAAAARKRRKELTRSKNVFRHQAPRNTTTEAAVPAAAS